METRY